VTRFLLVGILAMTWRVFFGGIRGMPRKRSIEERLKEAADQMVRLRDEKAMIAIRERMAKRTPKRRRK
jgi:hypothetical protein